MEPEIKESPAAVKGPVNRSGGPLAVLRRLPAWLRIALAVLLGVILLGVAFDVSTASPSLCASCHEMEARHASWAASEHVKVDCVQCHQAPTAWYELPQRVAGRIELLARDIAAHNAGEYTDPVDAPGGKASPIEDATCLQCHSANRQATSGYRILIDHVEHAERNGSCVSCHVRTAHPEEERSAALSFMRQCFTCHGTDEYPDAPVACDACHPTDYKLLPQSHDVADWLTEHPAALKADPNGCAMCHQQSFCDDCHGVEIPHPANWAVAHSKVADERGRDVCARCHGAGPDLCTSCHHSAYDASKGTWAEQHNAVVYASGAAQCLECHGGIFCSHCHTHLDEQQD